MATHPGDPAAQGLLRSLLRSAVAHEAGTLSEAPAVSAWFIAHAPVLARAENALATQGQWGLRCLAVRLQSRHPWQSVADVVERSASVRNARDLWRSECRRDARRCPIRRRHDPHGVPPIAGPSLHPTAQPLLRARGVLQAGVLTLHAASALASTSVDRDAAAASRIVDCEALVPRAHSLDTMSARIDQLLPFRTAGAAGQRTGPACTVRRGTTR